MESTLPFITGLGQDRIKISQERDYPVGSGGLPKWGQDRSGRCFGVEDGFGFYFISIYLFIDFTFSRLGVKIHSRVTF